MEHIFLCIQVSKTKGEENALQNCGDICQRCFEVMIHSFQSHVGATALASQSPRLVQTWCSSSEQSCACASLPHKHTTLPQAGVWAMPGNDVLRDLRLSPAFFFLGSFSHLFGLCVPQGRGSSPKPVEYSPQRCPSTARKIFCSEEGTTAIPVKKKTTYFPLGKNPTTTSKDFNSV